MRIGVILQHYDRRNDVRKLVDFISRYHDVVLFAIPKQAASVECRQEVRIIESRRVSIWNRLWNLCYLLFGNLPGDRKKYIEWKRGFFDSDRSRSGWTGRLILELSVRLPALVDFDTYLKYLQFDAKTRIGDIDVFLGFTDVNDPHFLAQVLAAKKPLATYVYSWDHPAKYHRFSKSWIRYLTWNEELKEDLIVLHGIPKSNILVVGSSQLCYVHEFIEANDRSDYVPVKGDFVYYAGAAGYRKVAEQEVHLMRCVAEILHEIQPAVKLVIRPYPIGHVFGLCADLARLPNVVIEDYREHDISTMFSDEGIERKLSAVSHAKAYVHIGSTLGIEASYLRTPVIHLDLQDVDLGVPKDHPSSMERLIHSFHSERYMLHHEYVNVVTSQDDLRKALEAALNNPDQLRDYNHRLSGMTKLRSFDEVASAILSVLEDAAPADSGHNATRVGTKSQGSGEPLSVASHSDSTVGY